MIVIAFTGTMVLSVLILLSLVYKRNERKTIDKKKNRLWVVYGLAMFIVDKFPKKLINSSQKMNTAIRALVVKEDIEKERYIYIVQKAAICIIAIWSTFFLTLAVCISEKSADNKLVTVTRSEKNDTEYSIQIENKTGEKEQVTINVAKKQFTKEQIEKIFNKRKKELIKKVLGENESTNKVNQNINLITDIGEEKISVSWNISDSSIIGYDGVLSKKISKEGEIVTLTATMILGKITQDYSFAVHVFPPVERNDMGEKLQKYVDENQKYKKQVKLPNQIDGVDVKYGNITSDISGYLLVIGVFISIALFFLKDVDLKKEADKRNQQMLNDYPEIVSKILLYYGAGLSIKWTVERIVKGYEEEKKNNKKMYRYAYEELSMCLIKMKSGISEISAINQYGKRCKLHCYVKLAGLIEQNMRRGTKELSMVLKSELREAMNDKKNNMLKNGGQISTKLLGPMVVMLIISIVIIMVPAFMSMDF